MLKASEDTNNHMTDNRATDENNTNHDLFSLSAHSERPSIVSSQTNIVCECHYKQYDGYCESCNQLICVECIFEEHKTHDIYNIEKVVHLSHKGFQ